MRVALVASLVLIIALWVVNQNARPLSTTEYFPETKHNVSGEFLKFFRERGELEVFGYPITDEFVDNEGRLLQYFQRFRMELDPDSPAQVQLGNLAEEMNLADRPVSAPDNSAGRFYTETGHTLHPNFAAFFDAYGGVALFGYPITKYLPENGRFVQYFQRARLEYYPDEAPAQRVQLAHLGSIYFVWASLPAELLGPVPARLSGSYLLVSASVAEPYTAYPGQQTVYVYVTSVTEQRSAPVQNASAVLKVRYPDGETSYTMPVTNNRGFASLTFDLESAPVGYNAVIRVEAELGPASGETQTSFVYWR
jgi:hypothetical protein